MRGLPTRCLVPRSPLTRMVVTMSVLLASESVTLRDPSLLLSVMLSPRLEFHMPICTEHSDQRLRLWGDAHSKEPPVSR